MYKINNIYNNISMVEAKMKPEAIKEFNSLYDKYENAKTSEDRINAIEALLYSQRDTRSSYDKMVSEFEANYGPL